MADFAQATERGGHASLAVPCPDCGAQALQRCKRPSGHEAAQLHVARRTLADVVFIKLHGDDAWLETVLVDGKPKTTIHPTGFKQQQQGG